MDAKIIKKRALRAERKVQILEAMVEDRTRDLYRSYQQLKRSADRLSGLHRVLPQSLFVVDGSGLVLQTNLAGLTLLGYAENEVVGKPLSLFFDSLTEERINTFDSTPVEKNLINSDGGLVPVLVSSAELNNSVDDQEADKEIVLICTDLRERKQLELDLRLAQKLESIGQLAAGIAHEINTPMQFIGDNVFFLQDSTQKLFTLLDYYKRSNDGLGDDDLSRAINSFEEAIDVNYLKDRMPGSIDSTLKGIVRVSKIVSAMKELSHPDTSQSLVDVNEAIDTAKTVSVNEYKYIARLETDLCDVPAVYCNYGDLNQILLNLIINAAHAISDRKSAERTDDFRGVIKIATNKIKDRVRIAVSDNGCGIPESIQHRIYDPFFTTKEVGKGTGQGLSFIRKLVERHNGHISFISQVNQGTIFSVELPINNPQNHIESELRS